MNRKSSEPVTSNLPTAMIKRRRLVVIAVLTASLALWFVQRRTITRLEVRISKLRAETTRIVDLEPVRAENRRLAGKKALAEELDRLRATTRELPQLRARLAQLEQKEKSLPNEAAAEDEASLTENEKLLKRLKEKGLYSFAQEDLPTLIRRSKYTLLSLSPPRIPSEEPAGAGT